MLASSRLALLVAAASRLSIIAVLPWPAEAKRKTQRSSLYVSGHAVVEHSSSAAANLTSDHTTCQQSVIGKCAALEYKHFPKLQEWLWGTKPKFESHRLDAIDPSDCKRSCTEWAMTKMMREQGGQPPLRSLEPDGIQVPTNLHASLCCQFTGGPAETSCIVSNGQVVATDIEPLTTQAWECHISAKDPRPKLTPKPVERPASPKPWDGHPIMSYPS